MTSGAKFSKIPVENNVLYSPPDGPGVELENGLDDAPVRIFRLFDVEGRETHRDSGEERRFR